MSAKGEILSRKKNSYNGDVPEYITHINATSTFHFNDTDSGVRWCHVRHLGWPTGWVRGRGRLEWMGVCHTCSHQEHRHAQVQAQGTAAITAREPVLWHLHVSHAAVSVSPSTPGFFASTNGCRHSMSFSVSVHTCLCSQLYMLSLARCSGESLECFFDTAEEEDWVWKVLLMLLLLLCPWRGVLGAQERPSGDLVSLRRM
jgi:hypothetical protein